jgi:hypothetical protein
MQSPRVYILTWCQRIELLYGTTLVFKTLRDGFPHADVYVTDSASISAARPEIRRAADACGVEFEQLDEHIDLYEFIHRVIERQTSGPVVFVDPDICFWQNVEQWKFDGLAAGRFIPRHRCDFMECLTEPRLHTSLLFFPDVARLRTAIEQVRQVRVCFEPFRPVMVPIGGGWHFFDGSAGLFGALRDEMRHFEECHLEAYDHLFCGSFSDEVLKKLQQDFAPAYRDVHLKAQADHRSVKGCWRLQEAYFQARRVAESRELGAG